MPADPPPSALSRVDEVIPAKAHWAAEMTAGETLRITDLEGKQAVDLICYSRDDLAEKFWAAHTAKLNRTIYVSEGHVLYSDRARPMMTITRDRVGVNDLICGSCSYDLDRFRYGTDKAAKGCMDNFAESVAPWGLTRADIPMCFNIFLNYPVRDDGFVSLEDTEPPSKAGDFMDLRAEMDLLVSISNCPQENNPCTGFNPTPLRAQIFADSSDLARLRDPRT